MTLANILKNKTPASAEALPLLSQKPTNCNFFI